MRQWSASQTGGSPIILLHDSLGSVEQWRDFPGELAVATSRSVVAYDRLGFGKSSRRVERPSTEFIAEEAEIVFPALMRALGIERFIPFGHSVGGAMALAVAAASGPNCDGVVSESAQAFIEPRTLSGIRQAQSEFSSPTQFAKLERWHGDKAQWVLDAWTGVWLAPAFSAWNLDPQLAKVTCPTLVIHGDRDEYGSVAFPQRIVTKVQGPSQLAILSAGHVPHRERRADVLQLVSAFLARVACGEFSARSSQAE